jgi:hypothetical protein
MSCDLGLCDLGLGKCLVTYVLLCIVRCDDYIHVYFVYVCIYVGTRHYVGNRELTMELLATFR